MPESPFSLTDIASVNAAVRGWAEPGVAVQPLRIDRLIAQNDALPALRDEVRRLARGGRALLLVDHTAMRRAGADLKALIETELSRVASLHVVALPEDSDDRFHADMESGVRLSERLHEHQLLIAVGSGSITDAAKYARHYLHEKANIRIPLISWPTAASVTAYTSALSVMTVDGVKRTLPTEPPDVVVCDRATLRSAPSAMTQAGFGDVLARSVSGADWWLASELGMTDGYSEAPMKLLRDAEERMLALAGGVSAREAEAVDAVTDAILLAGMAMSIVNQTAPLSGWEHAISHFLDLAAGNDGRHPALHGAQVGVATLVSARAYERGWRELECERILDVPIDSVARAAIERIYAPYDPRGVLLDELWRDYARKLERRRANVERQRRFVERYRAGELDSRLQALLRPAGEIESFLLDAGAPRRFADLTPPIPRRTAATGVATAHLIRARFTLGDLLADAGWLDDAAAAMLLDELAASG